MSYKKLIRGLSLTVSLAFCTPVFAVNNGTHPVSDPDAPQKESIIPGLWSDFKDKVSTTWNDSDSQDLYLPVITWHNRLTYDKEKTDRYNERPWGGGYGISRYDEKGNWNGIYFMAFKDSHNKWEPIGGYGWEKIWTPAQDKDFRLGLGYTAAVTARDDYKYIPIPIVLPLASIGYNKLTFQATYIPGTYNNGNVFFAWLRYQF
ncbi:phospholipid:lipid A palmitoyltransferase [Rahnella sp. AA]|uniref:lipid IV(A) palmitoyltransferase PagP n=1 Tax=Rahnella sp. AA TaxID=2057180 RepID=UPI000C320ADF|nr:lipid IV(A) palmitoyltransferase PagP [Rahnella sp. AA]PKE32950.1 phospholipid:lipid A palmitoyltransferase [Rahnella sp. AA]